MSDAQAKEPSQPAPHAAGWEGEAPSRAEPSYRSLFENAHDAMLVLDPDQGRVLDVNRRACALYGIARDEFLGLSLADLSENRSRDAEYVRRALAAGTCDPAETVHFRRDGGALRLEVNASAVEYASRPAVLSINRDITDRKQLEDQLRQSAKMEAVGQLAGGVAHDFNNLLTVINGYAEVLAAGLPPGDPAADSLTQIRDAGRRAEDLTRQLLAFSRKQVLRPRVIHLTELVENLRKMLVRLIGEDIRLSTVFDHDLGLVRADPGQLEQVLINLSVNARDAMPKGGTLTIEARNVYAGAPGRDGAARFVRLSVSDTGVGMTEEVKAKIFSPFFTTKGPGKGTGLGLATVHGIVQQSGGRIEVESRVGVGTTFRVDLPAIGAAPAAVAPLSALTGPAGGNETILLVEDEGAVRMLALHTLQAKGYAVLDAEDGEQALRVVQAYGVPVRLLVTDVVMPGLGGRDLAERLLAKQPGLLVLYMSGYTDDAIVRHGIEADRVNFLQKPFTPATLAKKVREVLDAAKA